MKKWGSRLLLYSCATMLALGVMNSSLLAGQASKKNNASESATANSTNAAKVDLNTASEKDLDGLPGVGSATAKKIIAGRPYSSVNDLAKAGISASTVKKIAPLVMVSAAAPAVSAKTASAKAPPAASQASPAAPSQPVAASPAKTTAKTTTSTTVQGSPGPGMVWVNLDSGVYHYQGTQYYGKTKNGKYISEADATAAGYHAAKNEKKPQ